MPRLYFEGPPRPLFRQDAGSSTGEPVEPKSARPDYITDFIIELNHSDKAKTRLRKWNESYGNDKITLIRTCPDSRVMTPEPTSEITVPYIAAGGNVSAAESLVHLKAVSNKVVMGHMSRKKFRLGTEIPRGCGGTEAKQAQMERERDGNGKGKEKVRGLDFYIREHIAHPDPVVNAALFVLAASGNNPRGIPILGAVQNHDDFTTEPVAAAVVTRNGEVDFIMQPKLSQYIFGFGDVPYDPKRIYENGMPTISIGRIPEESAEFLQKCYFMVEDMRHTYPDLSKMQEHQVGPLLALNGDIRHKGVMLPDVGDKPGGMFEVFNARTASGLGAVTPPKAFITSLRQLEYPMRLAVKNWGKDNADFGYSDAIWINADSNDLSAPMKATRAFFGEGAREWFMPWRERGGKLIITCSTNGWITDGKDY